MLTYVYQTNMLTFEWSEANLESVSVVLNIHTSQHHKVSCEIKLQKISITWDYHIIISSRILYFSKKKN